METFNTSEGKFQIIPAEVTEVIYHDSTPSLIYGIKAKILDGYPVSKTSSTVVTAKPLNTSILRIPLAGEVVLLIKATSPTATALKNAATIYYMDIVALQSSTHHNSLPTVANTSIQKNNAGGSADNYNNTSSGVVSKNTQPKVDSNFSESTSISLLQHYIGDTLIIGRYGNSLRLSTTPKSGNFTVKPKWSGSVGNPITILRTTPGAGSATKFSTEDFNKDDNIIVQASGQNIEFKQASSTLTAINSKKLNSWQSENWGKTPQTLISSGRVILNSAKKEIMLFAKAGIGLSSDTSIAMDAKNNISLNSTKIELGDNANHPVILTNDFLKALGSLVVMSPQGPCNPLQQSPQWSQVKQAISKISFVK